MNPLKDDTDYSQYQKFIGTCTLALEDDNVQPKIEDRDNLNKIYQEKCQQYDMLQQQSKVKKDNLLTLQLKHKELMQKMTQVTKYAMSVNEQINTVHETTTDTTNTNVSHSENFVAACAKIDEDFQNDYSQFKEETLTDQIDKISDELLKTEQYESQLTNSLQKVMLKAKPRKNPSAMKILARNIGDVKDIERVQKMISSRENSIQYLKNEIAKQADLLQNLD